MPGIVYQSFALWSLACDARDRAKEVVGPSRMDMTGTRRWPCSWRPPAPRRLSMSSPRVSCSTRRAGTARTAFHLFGGSLLPLLSREVRLRRMGLWHQSFELFRWRRDHESTPSSCGAQTRRLGLPFSAGSRSQKSTTPQPEGRLGGGPQPANSRPAG